MKLKFSDIEDAFMFVGSEQYGMHSAYLCPATGRIYYISEMAGIDEAEEEGVDVDECFFIPHKNELDLGRRLVFKYAMRRLPGEYEQVEQIFRKRGAYSRFKNFLETKGLLSDWYEFETECTERAIRQWCTDNDITLMD